MKHYARFFSVLSTGTLLGCSQLSLAPTAGAPVAASVLHRVQPVQRLSSPVADVERLLNQGRSAQGLGQLTLAEQHYRQLLQRQPSHPGALNSLAVIYAQTDRLEQAIGLFKQALALEPQASHLLNNLGYALLLAGRLSESESALQRAQDLNPSSTLTQKNRELLAQAKERTAVVLANTVSTATEVAAPVTTNGASMVAVAPNVYELRDTPAARPLAAAQLTAQADATASVPLSSTTPVARVMPTAPTLDASAALRGVRLEVSNGVGVRHMARRTAERLAPLGLVAARLTNQPGYQQKRTELQFGAGQKDAAQALSLQMPQAPRLIPAKWLVGNIQLRLVLGHDLMGKAVASWLDTPETPQAPPPVALNPREGWRWV